MNKLCGACGFVGHIHLEWGSGEHDETKLERGDWLKGDWQTWHGQNIGGNQGGGMSAQGWGTEGVGG
jgi:hypothetical protein